jgi:hypothetical protein
MNGDVRRPVRAAVKVALIAGALATSLALQSMSVARAAATTGMCSSGSSRGEANRLSSDIGRAVGSRHGAVSVAFVDLDSGVACGLRSRDRFDSASVIKATILATLLFQAKARHQWPNSHQRALATSMITRSDNGAASALWSRVGGAAGVQRFLHAAGMADTVPGRGGRWGLSRITAADQVKLLTLLVRDNGVLDRRSRAFELGLMSHVVAGQRWGAPTGAARGESVAVKNGWLPRSFLGWRINTLGAATGRHTYVLAILSDGNPSMGYGVTTVSRIAAAINRDVL